MLPRTPFTNPKGMGWNKVSSDLKEEDNVVFMRFGPSLTSLHLPGARVQMRENVFSSARSAI